MSLLFPLYAAGLAALSLPILFHLMQRTPSGRQRFGSLMFLSASPPQFVRRKSVDQIALLCLRALILALVAMAFARPYLRAEEWVAADAQAPEVALLVDTSASMRRDGVWERALRAVETKLADVEPDSALALYTFDRELDVLVGFEQTRGMRLRTASELVLERLGSLQPGWSRTDLGRALAQCAEELAGRAARPGYAATIVLVSDLQEGADLTELESFDWPDTVDLELAPVAAEAGNASIHPLAGDSGSNELVRVVNSANATSSQFELRWTDPDGRAGPAVSVLCPPGESRTVQAPARPDEQFGLLVLTGDEVGFDNVLHARPRDTSKIGVIVTGTADEGEQGLDFFLDRVLDLGDGSRVETEYRPSVANTVLDAVQTSLIVAKLDGNTSEADAQALVDFAERGGVVFAAMLAPRHGGVASAVLEALLGEPSTARDVADESDFALLGDIDFEHPLFAPFADPRYSDFTKIRFWRHWHVDVGAGSELGMPARFDDGQPFLIERVCGTGRILVATSSWDRADSDLARSSKFAPLVHGLLRLGAVLDFSGRAFRVGDPVPLPALPGRELSVVLPNGEERSMSSATAFTATSEPGSYEIRLGARNIPFAVYLDAQESRVDPLETDRFARFGMRVSEAASGEEQEQQRLEKRDELERRQKLWRWLLCAALGGILVETVWAGRLARGRTNRESVS